MERPKPPYAARRQRLLESLPPWTAVVLASQPTAFRNSDVEHDYRQDSDVLYFAGIEEPDCVLVFAPRGRVRAKTDFGTPEDSGTPAPFSVFLRPRDAEQERWDGPRIGVEGAKQVFGADAAFPISELESKLPGLLRGHREVVYRLGNGLDGRILQAIRAARRAASKGRDGDYYPIRITDPVELVHTLRWRKDSYEIDVLRRACAISVEAQRRAMAMAAPGRTEADVESVLLASFREQGSERPAYGSIVGSGANATVLHHRENRRRIEDGDLVLIDAACELDGYASDITRTFPANGRFSEPQRAVYQAVLDAQLACIAAARPGVSLEQLHRISVRSLTEALVRLRVLSGDVDVLIEEQKYKLYYPHRIGHYLGMDVHDVGPYVLEPTQPDAPIAHRPMEPGVVFTVEPGLYFPAQDDRVPAELRGIGVRIEDDVLITEHGCEVLTAGLAKTLDEVEAACRRP